MLQEKNQNVTKYKLFSAQEINFIQMHVKSTINLETFTSKEIRIEILITNINW